MKKMFVVVEVEDSHRDYVKPVGPSIPSCPEYIHKSRVIYADEMRISDSYYQGGQIKMKEILLLGVSPTPKPKDEWEESSARLLFNADFTLDQIEAILAVCKTLRREKL